MTFPEFLTHIYSADRGEQRLGQFAFNELVLRASRKDLADKIHSTVYDPFYQDQNLTRFLDYVQREW